MNKPTQQWGPVAPVKSNRGRRAMSVVVFVVLIMLPGKPYILIPVLTLLACVLTYRCYQFATSHRPRLSPAPASTSSLPEAREQVRRLGGGAFLGVSEAGQWRLARRERAVLVLGPPRSGKSSGLIIPTVLTCPGPVVSTSTKPDILTATAAARSQVGKVWEFDPTGHTPATSRSLRWSPVTCAVSWDGALMMARAMVAGSGVGAGTTDATHWAKRATALLAPLLHAAALDHLNIGQVLEWVLAHHLDPARQILTEHAAQLPASTLVGLGHTEARERSSIFSAAADALEAYTSHGALTAATDPNFDAARFVSSTDAIYIHAPAEHQALAAPLVCGLLAEIRRATYHAHAQGHLPHPVLFALDEAANIAPLAELPSIASEGGGQGLSLIAAFQDLSQARHRWGPLADGFLTLFGDKLILPGVADPQTLDAISVALGEYDRPVTSTTHNPASGQGSVASMLIGSGGVSRTTTTQRQRILSPGEIANIPTGHTLHLDGLRWELMHQVNAHRDQPWQTLTSQSSVAQSVGSGR